MPRARICRRPAETSAGRSCSGVGTPPVSPHILRAQLALHSVIVFSPQTSRPRSNPCRLDLAQCSAPPHSAGSQGERRRAAQPGGVTDMTDYFLIASGTSDTHVRAIGEHVLRGDEEGRQRRTTWRARAGPLGAARLRRFRRARLPSDAARLLPARAPVGRRRQSSPIDAEEARV